MGKLFFIASLLLLYVSRVEAQQTNEANDIVFERVMPYGWSNSVPAVVLVVDANGKEVKKVSTTIRPEKTTTIDISKLGPGAYTLKVIPKNRKLQPDEFSRDFKNEKAGKRLLLTFSKRDTKEMRAYKPVIYLYPEHEQPTSVKVCLKGNFTVTIPEYKDGWQVTARPDGTITNADGKQYPYLFWEGDTYKQDWNMTEGFVVSGADSRIFLQRVLPEMGLIAREYNEFIDFWAPVLQKNDYNLIRFAGAEYDDAAKLVIDPTPAAVLRVFMVFRPADKSTKVLPQRFKPFVRKGFTVVEWGGMLVPGDRTAKK